MHIFFFLAFALAAIILIGKISTVKIRLQNESQLDFLDGWVNDLLVKVSDPRINGCTADANRQILRIHLELVELRSSNQSEDNALRVQDDIRLCHGELTTIERHLEGRITKRLG